MNIKRKRVKAYVDALGELLMNNEPSRELAINLVRKALERENVEPLRGASKPDDIYEKELISLYIIGNRGLGIKDEYKDLFEKVFHKEIKYDRIVQVLLSSNSPARAREAILEILPELSEVDVAKILRYALTLYYLDFEKAELVIDVIRKLRDAFPEHEDTIRRFTKFFIAVKLADEISSGGIRNRVEKEIRKQLLSIKTGIEKSTPSDDYVVKVAKVVFNIPSKTLENIFGNGQ
ncbi:MAG: DUF2192 domain-containing protein [Desulfurococcales archaeon]|nr:DUF2192 domain-containing protein [Desulfurococcales archaeon]